MSVCIISITFATIGQSAASQPLTVHWRTNCQRKKNQLKPKQGNKETCTTLTGNIILTFFCSLMRKSSWGYIPGQSGICTEIWIVFLLHINIKIVIIVRDRVVLISLPNSPLILVPPFHFTTHFVWREFPYARLCYGYVCYRSRCCWRFCCSVWCFWTAIDLFVALWSSSNPSPPPLFPERFSPATTSECTLGCLEFRCLILRGYWFVVFSPLASR